MAGLQVGWTVFDRLTNGGQAGDLIIVCARAKMGKSVILTNWAKTFAIEDELPVLYIDTEMTSEEQEDRLVSMITQIPVQEIVTGLFAVDTENGTAQEKIQKIKNAIQQIKNAPIDLRDDEQYAMLNVLDYETELDVIELKESFKLGFKEALIYLNNMGMLKLN